MFQSLAGSVSVSQSQSPQFQAWFHYCSRFQALLLGLVEVSSHFNTVFSVGSRHVFQSIVPISILYISVFTTSQIPLFSTSATHAHFSRIHSRFGPLLVFTFLVPFPIPIHSPAAARRCAYLIFSLFLSFHPCNLRLVSLILCLQVSIQTGPLIVFLV